MAKNFLRALALLLLFTIVLGFGYPLVVTGIGRILFPFQATGALIFRGGVPVGSSLIGQAFLSPRYFHGRPSAAGEKGYDAMASSGSNLGPTNAKWLEAVHRRILEVRRENGLRPDEPVPADLVCASASGLDPDISLSSARLQVTRVAASRNLPVSVVSSLVKKETASPLFGFLGEPRVNVLKLNLALDALEAPKTSKGSTREVLP